MNIVKILVLTLLISSPVYAHEEQSDRHGKPRAALTAEQAAEAKCRDEMREHALVHEVMWRQWREHRTLAEINAETDVNANDWHDLNIEHLKKYHNADANYAREVCESHYKRNVGVTKAPGDSTTHSWSSIFGNDSTPAK